MKNKKRNGVFGKFEKYNISKIERYNHYYNALKNIAMNRFRYINMPPEIDVRFLELTLFEIGYAVFYKDEFVNLYVALTAMWGGEMDIYNNPVMRNAYASNGYQYYLTANDSVLIYNNYLRKNGQEACHYFATRLANAEAVVDINMGAQKTPKIIMSPEEQRLTLKNLIEQYEDDIEVIYGTNNMDLEAIKALDIGAPFIADKAQEIKQQIWNEALTYYGIPNLVESKKERMIADEVNRLMGGSLISGASDLDMRQECFNKVNQMFGLDIKVERKFIENVSRETSENNVEDEVIVVE